MLQFMLDLLSAASTPSIRPAPGPPDAAAHHTHPRANRRVRLADVLVEYELRRGRRRTIGFAVGPEGLTVSAPRWTSQAEIDAALDEKTRWITTHLMQARERAARLAAMHMDWRMGAAIPYLGAPVILVADPGAPKTSGRAILDPPDAIPGGSPPQVLRLSLPPNAAPAQWRAATAAWLMRQARRLFTARLDRYAPQLDVRWQRLSLSSARTRWGSASSQGWIRLNWRLIHLSLPVIDYVVVHELAHLREMNHSPRFWALVNAILPDYATHRATLRDAVLPIF
jgi:predicted metal-dependent hydrolase